MDGDEALGFISIIETRRFRHFDEDEAKLAQLLASQAGSAFKQLEEAVWCLTWVFSGKLKRPMDEVIMMRLLRNRTTGILIFGLFATVVGLSIAYFQRETKKREEAEAERAFEFRAVRRRAS